MGPSERQSKILWSSVTSLAVGILIVLVGLLVWSLGWIVNRLASVLIPLAIAGVLAYILDPVVDFLDRKIKSRTQSIFLVFALAVFLVLGLAATVLPRLATEVQSFTAQVPAYVSKLRERVDQFVAHPPTWFPHRFISAPPPPLPLTSQESTNVVNAPALPAESQDQSGLKLQSQLSDSLVGWTGKFLPKLGSWVMDQLSFAASLAGLLAGLALVPVYLFYFLLEKNGIQQRWHEFLPIRESHVKNEVIFVLNSINDCLIVFFRGQVLVAMCVGTILAVGFSLVGLNYALLLGVMAGCLGVVPYLGVALSLIPAVTIAVAQFGDLWHPLGVLGVFAVAQMLEGLVISPKIIGDRVGLHPLTIIIAVMVGTTLLGGILGGVLAIPLTAAFRTLMFRYVWRQHQGTQALPESQPSESAAP